MLGIFVNEQFVFEYDTSTELDDQQLAFLQKMDADMDKGIKIYGELIVKPDSEAKANFVVMNLLKSLQQQDDAKIGVSCAYLSQNYPNVVEVHARDEGNRIGVELVESH
ncbi:MAG: hypothetical protein ISR69_00785 [Gammaproteobacteria bacterium]|nr:hypothetical protein [Gammaproteobacteria bacterium]